MSGESQFCNDMIALVKTLLAIDAGGTSTRCALVSSDGDCLGYARTGSGNPVSSGHDSSVASISLAAEIALDRADGSDVEAVFIGMAGGGEAPRERLIAALRSLGVISPVHIEGDLLPIFCSGTLSQSGYALVAGTGATAIRVEDGGVDATADGLGWLLGDEGSGFWIGRRVAQAVLADVDGRGPHTSMTVPFFEQLGLSMTDETAEGRPEVVSSAMSRLYGEPPVKLARFSRLACETSDPVASAIIDEALDRLGNTLRTLFMPGLAGPIVLGGGLLSHNPSFVERLRQMWDTDPSVLHVVDDGLAGACVLAMRMAGMAVDEAMFARIRASMGVRSVAA